ncbi:MAG: hypothetical protein WBA93_27235 [Microcoleaceae cyanobacterium]
MEMERRNNLYHWNGDTFDEQMAGFGYLIDDIKESIKIMAENADNHK